MRTYLSSLMLAAVLGLTLLVATSACAGKSQYRDPAAVDENNPWFNSTDLHMFATLVDEMLVFPTIRDATANRRPTIFVDRIKNKTMEHIDTESVTDTIMTKLVQSGKFRYAPRDKVEELLNEQDFQRTGVVDPATAVRFGKIAGAEYMLYGNLSSIVYRTKGQHEVYYKLTLHIVNVETGVVEWMGEKEILKQFKRPLFGR